METYGAYKYSTYYTVFFEFIIRNVYGCITVVKNETRWRNLKFYKTRGDSRHISHSFERLGNSNTFLKHIFFWYTFNYSLFNTGCPKRKCYKKKARIAAVYF